MELKKSKHIILGVGLTLISCTSASALTTEELNDYILSVYSERYYATDRLCEYLEKKGVKISEYKKYLEKLEKYKNSTEYLVERIENGSILMDEVLFSNKDVRNQYDKALKELKSEVLAYQLVKKNMMNNSKELISKYHEYLKNKDNFRKAFVDKINRSLSPFEEIWLNGSVYRPKHALYASAKGGYLEFEDEAMSMDNIEYYIENGEGYRVLGLTENDMAEYGKFIKEREKFDKLIIDYVKLYSMFDGIYTEIISKYGVNIFEVLTERDKLNVYNKSIDGFVFNEDKALDVILKMLVSKGVLTEVDLKGDKNEVIEQDSSASISWAELEKYLKEKDLNSGKGNDLSDLYSSKGLETMHKNLSENFIWFKFEDRDENTYLRVTNDRKISGSMFEDLIDILEKEIELKTVFSKNEMLTFLKNEIKTYKIHLAEDVDIEFDEIVKIFDELGIKLYLRKIDYTESLNDSSVIEETSGVQGDGELVYKMSINLKDKMLVYNLGEKKVLEEKDIKEILYSLDAKCVVSNDSVLVLKDNEIKVIDSIGLENNEITVNEFKTILENLDEKVSIQVTS